MTSDEVKDFCRDLLLELREWRRRKADIERRDLTLTADKVELASALDLMVTAFMAHVGDRQFEAIDPADKETVLYKAIDDVLNGE